MINNMTTIIVQNWQHKNIIVIMFYLESGHIGH